MPPATDHTASWQSIWWALVSIALNTALQPRGATLSLPLPLAILSALNPLLLLADVLLLALKLIHLTLTYRLPARPALRVLVATRGHHGPGAAGHAAWWFRPVAFALGALPQYVKLFAISGVPMTQAWASMYLVSFVLLEAFLYLGRPAPAPAPADGEPAAGGAGVAEEEAERAAAELAKRPSLLALEAAVTLVCALAQLGWALWAASRVGARLRDGAALEHPLAAAVFSTASRCVAGSANFAALGMFLACSLVGAERPRWWRRRVPRTEVLGVVAVGFFVARLIVLALYAAALRPAARVDKLWVLGLQLVFLAVMGLVVLTSGPRNVGYLLVTLCVVSGVVALLSALAFYWLVYNPVGTYKAPWVENFG